MQQEEPDNLSKEETSVDLSIELKEPSVDSLGTTFFKNKYFLVAIFLAIAGILYGITYAIDILQINFTLYCCSVWLVCLALIFLVNYKSSSV
jgi:hypothetical protein